jgi:hypothetical protein
VNCPFEADAISNHVNWPESKNEAISTDNTTESKSHLYGELSRLVVGASVTELSPLLGVT